MRIDEELMEIWLNEVCDTITTGTIVVIIDYDWVYYFLYFFVYLFCISLNI